MESFVAPGSIVRKIWGPTDMVLFIFGGAAAEFALNKSVDWLFFTGRLPQDPLARLCATVAYARAIIFTPYHQASAALQQINHIHAQVEQSRQSRIPPEAYRDVLYLLIHYSIAAFELLERPLSPAEQEEVFRVFQAVGKHMQLESLPDDYTAWLEDRSIHLRHNLVYSTYTAALLQQYLRQLGPYRYQLMLQVQQLVCPVEVRLQLQLKARGWFRPLLRVYQLCRSRHIVQRLIPYLLPQPYPRLLLAQHSPSSTPETHENSYH